MRPRSIRFLFCALGLVAAAACSRILITEPGTSPTTTTPRDSVARLLVGSWDLRQGCGGLAYRCADASQLNEPGRYVFSADGRVKAYRGNSLLFETSYSITPGATGENAEHRALLTIGGGPLVDPRPLLVRFASKNALFLDEGCCDRFEFEFARS